MPTKTVDAAKPVLPDTLSLSLADLVERFATHLEGLSASEAARQLKQYGPNIATDAKRSPLWMQFLARFRSPLVILLLIASGLSAITGDIASFTIIVAMVILSVSLDFYQEVRAENTVDALRNSVSVKANVLRDGKETILPFKYVVPGDVVLLSPGDLSPADGRLISAKDLFVNQAMLTGESFPAEKRSNELTVAPADMASALNAVFMGTSIISGTARMLVTATGKQSQLGQLAKSLVATAPPTNFEQGVEKFGTLILRLTFLLVMFVVLINLFFHRPLLQSFLFALALAVGLTPELLPMMMTITLSRGATRMAKKRVIVKHLPAMHNLGAMDVLCTDKTGTLTEARIVMKSALDSQGMESDRVFALAYLNSFFETGVKSPLDQAIVDRPRGTLPAVDTTVWTKRDEVPFDFERRRVSVLLAGATALQLIVKGAPEDVLKLSTQYETSDGQIQVLDSDQRAGLLKSFDGLGKQGLRVLALAVKAFPADHTAASARDEDDLVFAGFTTFMDPPKLSAAKALQDLASSGINVKIISGDNEFVTQHVCDSLGIKSKGVLVGADMIHMTDEALRARVDHTTLFCRVTPGQKSRIIATLKKLGHTVGYMGDGINDASALHDADVGISVDSASDVAKEAADIILLDQDLSVIHDGVLEGRQAVVNTQKYILMGSSSNFGTMFSMAGASLFLPFLAMLPIQILLNNLLYDVSQIALPFDYVDKEATKAPVHWDIGRIKRFMIILGPTSSIFDFVTFFVMLKLFGQNETLFHSGWFVESLLTQVLIVFAIRTRKFMFTSRPHPFVIAMALGIATVSLLLPFTAAGDWFHLAPLPWIFFAFLAGTLVAYFALVETMKVIFRRWL